MPEVPPEIEKLRAQSVRPCAKRKVRATVLHIDLDQPVVTLADAEAAVRACEQRVQDAYEDALARTLARENVAIKRTYAAFLRIEERFGRRKGTADE